MANVHKGSVKVNESSKGTGGGFCCCFGSNMSQYVKEELEETIKAVKAAPPVELIYGYAKDQTGNSSRGIIEVVNKGGRGECIGVLFAPNAAELALKGRDVKGFVGSHMGFLPDQSVMTGQFDAGNTSAMQIALWYGGTNPSPDYKVVHGVVASHNVKAKHFKEVKVYQVRCMGKNILLKYKGNGEFMPQKGQGGIFGRRTSLGAGIDMSSNVTELELVIE